MEYQNLFRNHIDYSNVVPLDKDEREQLQEMLNEGEIVYVFIYRRKFLFSDSSFIGAGPGTPAFVIADKNKFPNGFKA